jgi:folate-binding protein YgfZ
VWLDTEAIATQRVLRHLGMYKVGRDVELADVGDKHVILSVIGPSCPRVIAAASGADAVIAGMPEHAHHEIEIGAVGARAVGTYLGVDLIAPAAEVGGVRSALLEAGAVGVSFDAAEILRVESGRPRYGAEMGEATIPAEAGINERAVSFTKGCYIGQETVSRLHYKGRPNRHLRGLRLSAPARAGEVIRLGDREVGQIGTACISPALGPIALAIVRREAAPGDRVAVGDGGALAELTELPF